mmetsp:Transcript_12926/g.11714  ORF Transcript_12926/g.11714 Transcript_12926/m.11714 type:complete len:273 (+) Transcript_12926:55-873(+)
MDTDNIDNQDDMEDYLDANNQQSRRKRGLGLCKLCGMFGHYQKTCPTIGGLGTYSTNPNLPDDQQNDEDSDEIDENSNSAGHDGLHKMKKSKHPKFLSNANETVANILGSGNENHANIQADDYSTDDEPIDHKSLVEMSSSSLVADPNDQYQQQLSQLTGNDLLNFDKNPANSRRWGTWKKDMRRFVGNHFAVRVKDEKTLEGKIKDKRHRCKYSNCKRKSKFKCLTCEVFLCIGCSDADNCFLQFHTFSPNSGVNIGNGYNPEQIQQNELA